MKGTRNNDTEKTTVFSGIQGPCGTRGVTEDKTLAQLSSEFDVRPNQITEWKRQALAALPEVFSKKREHQQQDQQALVDRLYRQIG